MNIDPFYSHRHTVRSFSSRPVDTEILSAMLEAASHAPNTGNMQLYSVIITTDAENLRRLTPAHFNQPAATNAPAILTFCADFRRFEHWCRLSDATPGFDNLQSLLAGIIDTSIFAQQFVTIAEQNGLGTCYLGTTTYNAAEIAQALSLPSRVVPVISVSVGYPEGENQGSARLPINAIVHHEHYEDYSDNDIHEAFDVHDSSPEAAKFIAENAKTSLAQVFTDVRYPKASSDIFSAKFMDFLRAAGFSI